jgi:ribA/ribD-fused uncharacterized protein
MSDETEGEEEVQLVKPQVQVAEAAPEAKADEDLGVLGIVPTLPEEDAWWEKGVPEEEKTPLGEVEEEVEEELENDPEETEEERSNRKARRKYIKFITAFYREREAFFKMQRNTTPAGKLAFRESFRKGKNDSKLATYGRDGTLTLTGKDGKVIDSVKPPSYHEPELEDHEKLDKWRLKQIKEAEKAFEDAKQILREAIVAGRHVKRSQRLVGEADLALQTARFATKGVAYYKKVVMNQLLFENPYDVHKTEAYAFVSTSMTSQQRYAVQDIPGEENEEEETSPESVESDVILFSNADGPHGFLSSWYMQKFKYKGIRYRCAFQAIMAEMARKFGDDERAEEIMEATDPEDMTLTFDEFEDATQGKWRARLKKLILKVNRAKFEKEDLGKLLMKTGDKHLGCIPPEDELDGYQGIGIGFGSSRAYRRDKWKKGGNQYGKILEQIRNELVVAKNPSLKRPTKAKPKVEETKEEEEDDEGEAREEDAGDEEGGEGDEEEEEEEEGEEEEEEEEGEEGEEEEGDEEEGKTGVASIAKRAIYQAKRKVYLEEYAQAIKDGDKAGAARILAQAKKAGIDIPVTKAAAKLDQTEATTKPKAAVAEPKAAVAEPKAAVAESKDADTESKAAETKPKVGLKRKTAV